MQKRRNKKIPTYSVISLPWINLSSPIQVSDISFHATYTLVRDEKSLGIRVANSCIRGGSVGSRLAIGAEWKYRTRESTKVFRPRRTHLHARNWQRRLRGQAHVSVNQRKRKVTKPCTQSFCYSVATLPVHVRALTSSSSSRFLISERGCGLSPRSRCSGSTTSQGRTGASARGMSHCMRRRSDEGNRGR